MSRLARFFRLPDLERRLALEALFYLAAARAAVLVLPFRWVASILGQPLKQAAAETETIELPRPEARAVGRAIARVRRHTPWHSNCLAQALAGFWMLRRRSIPGTLFFGMTRNAGGNLEAHAWLRCGGAILTGGGGLHRYSVVAAFAHS